MYLENSFTVPADIGTSWTTLLDIEGIAPCVVGATLVAVDGNRYDALVRVKVGPVGRTYEGSATVVSADEGSHRAVIEGSGRDSKGVSTARAVVTLQLVELEPQVTRVDVLTDFTLTSRTADFGPALLVDASRRVVDQFAGNLAHVLSVRRAAS
jgi:uncharacterized protein